MSAYRCPSCGTSDPLGYVRCNQSSCPDGRDPRPQYDAEVDHLRVQVASLQEELAERTAERDFEAHVNKMLLSWAADNGCEPDLLLSEWMGEKARADTLARRAEGLEAALRDQFCPRSCNGRPDKFGVGDCVDAGECGCSARAALTGERRQWIG